MTTIEYSLFRAKFIKPHLLPLNETSSQTPQQIMLTAISQAPQMEAKRGYVWHIGNIEYFSKAKDTGYFAVGRTTRESLPRFNPETREFLEVEFETSPYTHCVFDSTLGLVGIAKNTNLAATAKGVASRLQHLLEQASVAVENEVTVEIAPIPDPEGFLKSIASAYRVTRFTAHFTGPNPFDADKFFQKPLSVYLSAADGQKGKAAIQEQDLKRDVIAEVARSTAATGNEASARITKSRNQKPITINLKGDPVKKRYDEAHHRPQQVLADLVALYDHLRHD